MWYDANETTIHNDTNINNYRYTKITNIPKTVLPPLLLTVISYIYT